MADLRARQVHQDDYGQFDYIVAMDEENLSVLLASCPEAERARLSLMLDWTTGWGSEVPDPYYGGDEGFEQVFDMLTDACHGLIHQIRERLGLPAIEQTD